MTHSILVLGAVAYSPKVVTIWEGFKEYFEQNGLPFDFVLFSNYERQVEALFQESIDVAWNSPLAWIRAERIGRAQGKPVRALLMRDSDQDLRSVFLTRKNSGLKKLEDLKGKKIGFGAIDSPQATLIPLETLRAIGINPDSDIHAVYFNLLPGKHGDHIGGEEEAAQALLSEQVDACALLEANYQSFQSQGILGPEVTVLEKTAPFDHCNFTVAPHADAGNIQLFERLLLGMNYEDPTIRQLMDLEGLKAWKNGRVNGYEILERAVSHSCFYSNGGEIEMKGYRY